MIFDVHDNSDASLNRDVTFLYEDYVNFGLSESRPKNEEPAVFSFGHGSWISFAFFFHGD